MRMRLRRTSTTAAATLAVLAGVQPAAPLTGVRAAEPELRFLDYNMCGNVCWKAGDPENASGRDTRGETATRTSRIVHAVDHHDPDLLFFNETCYSQFHALRAELRGRGYHAAFSATTTGGRCDRHDTAHGRKFGNALFSKRALLEGPTGGAVETYDLGGANRSADGVPRHYQLLCAETELRSRPATACVTHLRADSPSVRDAQARKAAGLVRRFAGSRPTVLAGDLNVEPRTRQAGYFYGHSGGDGVFQEADENDRAHRSGWPRDAARGRAGEPTFRETKKIDYVFLSDRHFRRVSGDAASRHPSPISDHSLYRAAARWQR